MSIKRFTNRLAAIWINFQMISDIANETFWGILNLAWTVAIIAVLIYACEWLSTILESIE